jgi:hypothetical protein
MKHYTHKFTIILLFTLFTFFSSLSFSQSIDSNQLMKVADEIYALTKTVEAYKESSRQIKRSQWDSISDDIKQVANTYRLASVYSAILEKGVSIDLRKFHFGNKLANKNNQDETDSEILTGWMSAGAIAKFFGELEKSMPEIALEINSLKSRLQASNEQITPYANKILERASKMR